MSLRDPRDAHLKAAQQAARVAESKRAHRAELHAEAFRRYHAVLHRRERFTVKVDEQANRHDAWIVDVPGKPVPIDRAALDFWMRAGWVSWWEIKRHEEKGLRQYQIEAAGWAVLEAGK